MQYINKSLDREEGNHITKEYLRAIWLREECRYPVDYNGTFHSLPTSEDSYSSRMMSVLLKNQNYYCCYCMRRLTGNDDTTLEHIVPQTATEKDFEEYKKDEFTHIKEHLLLSSEYTKKKNPSFDPLPHTVAYDNLVASCKGLFPKLSKIGNAEQDESGHCCNNKRGNDKALPIYFLHDVSDIIRYHKSGRIIYEYNDPWYEACVEMVGNARLNWETLTDIRQLWFVMRDVPKRDILSCKDENERRDLIQDNLYLTDINGDRIKQLTKKFKKKEYWSVFLLYDWFHTIKWAVR